MIRCYCFPFFQQKKNPTDVLSSRLIICLLIAWPKCVCKKKTNKNTSTHDFKLFAAQTSTDLILPLLFSFQRRPSKPSSALKNRCRNLWFCFVLCMCVFGAAHLTTAACSVKWRKTLLKFVLLLSLLLWSLPRTAINKVSDILANRTSSVVPSCMKSLRPRFSSSPF